MTKLKPMNTATLYPKLYPPQVAVQYTLTPCLILTTLIRTQSLLSDTRFFLFFFLLRLVLRLVLRVFSCLYSHLYPVTLCSSRRVYNYFK